MFTILEKLSSWAAPDMHAEVCTGRAFHITDTSSFLRPFECRDSVTLSNVRKEYIQLFNCSRYKSARFKELFCLPAMEGMVLFLSGSFFESLHFSVTSSKAGLNQHGEQKHRSGNKLLFGGKPLQRHSMFSVECPDN